MSCNIFLSGRIGQVIYLWFFPKIMIFVVDFLNPKLHLEFGWIDQRGRSVEVSLPMSTILYLYNSFYGRYLLGFIGRVVPKMATAGGPKCENNTTSILSKYTTVGTNVLVRFI